MKSRLAVQKAQLTDQSAIGELLEQCNLPYQDLTGEHLDHFFLVRSGDGDHSIAGVAGLEIHGGSGLVRSLAVAPSHRGEGMGNRLVQRLETYAREQDLETLYLLTTTAADYFANRGYEVIEREGIPETIKQSRQFTEICPSSAIAMQKRLS